jgi:hypothetical protein
MKKCYIAGPMRGIPDFNFPAFNHCTARLRESGYHVFSPAEMDKIYAPEVLEDNKESTAKGKEICNSMHDYVRRDLHIIVNELKPENGDFLVVLPGWERSTGAVAEVGVARWCKLNVYAYHPESDADVDGKISLVHMP